MKCKLCGADEPRLAKSHIFPKGFFGKLQNKANIQTWSTNRKGRKLPAALWDRNILCQNCEELTAPLDDYAIKIFRDHQNSFNLKGNFKTGDAILVFENLDTKKLRKFFASMLWRISVSSQMEISNLSIGSHYENIIANDLLNNGNFSYVDCYTFILTDPRHSVFLTPYRHRLQPLNTSRDHQNINGWRFEMPNLIFWVSLDKRSHPYNHYMQAKPDSTHLNHDIYISSSLNAKDKDSNYDYFCCFKTEKIDHLIRRNFNYFYSSNIIQRHL